VPGVRGDRGVRRQIASFLKIEIDIGIAYPNLTRVLPATQIVRVHEHVYEYDWQFGIFRIDLNVGYTSMT